MREPNRALMLIMPEVADRPIRPAGDPTVCAGTEWLSQAGRAKARRIGERLRAEGFGKAAVFASRSCGAMAAAMAMGLGKVSVQPLLDDIAKTPLSRQRQRQEFGLFVADYHGEPAFVLVTHRNNVLDLSGMYLGPGDGIILESNLSADVPRVIGSVRFD